MINVSNAFREKMKEGRGFKTYAEVIFSDGSGINLDCSQFTVTGNKLTDGADNSDFPLGIAVLKSVQLEILNDAEQYKNCYFSGAKIRVYLEFDLGDETERIEKGTYTVIAPETYGETITITAYDDMYKADKDYTTALTFPQTAGAVLRDICSSCGISLGSNSFLHDDFLINEKPSGKFREVIGYIAMIACGNARIDRRNALQIIPYDFGGFGIEGNYHVLAEWSNPKLEYNDTIITGFSTTIKGEELEDDTEVVVGTDAYMVTVENPLITGKEETVLSWLYERIGNIPFRPFSGELVSNPLIEFMDLCKIGDRHGNEYNSFVSDADFVFDGYTEVRNSTPGMPRSVMSYGSGTAKTEIYIRKLVQAEKTARELAVQNLQKVLSESSGLHETDEAQEDGSTIYYLHDKPTLEESKNVIKLTAEAIGFSTDGGETYPYGFRLTGEMITRILQTEGINADWINAGALTVRDAEGNIIFSVDMDTKQIIISGDSVQIGGKTATQAITDLEAKVGQAVAISIVLDNEYQGISTDYEGNYNTFPEVKTTVTVLHGQLDVSEDCSYSTAKSAGVTGNWSSATRTYTVTALSADTGWVDITATYLSLYIVTKRFNLAKVKGGEPGAQGADGRTYFIEPSTTIIKYAKDNSVSPNYVEFKAYYRDGVSPARTPYAGRFVIEESDDGETWTTKYTSDEDETEIFHSMYNVLATASGNIIVTDTGQAIIVQPRHPLSVRCTLYAAGGTTTALDTQSIIAVKDVDALTHEEIFNLLTNNGEIKGIYKEGNQLFISFTYAKGGELVLGGADNQHGILRVLDELGSDFNTTINNAGIETPLLTTDWTVIGRGGNIENDNITIYPHMLQAWTGEGGYASAIDFHSGVDIFTPGESIRIGTGDVLGMTSAFYILNNGLNPGGHTERHVFNGTVRFAGTDMFANIINATAINSSGSLTIIRTLTEARVNLINNFHSGRVVASESGKFGLYDVTNSKWIIYSDSTGNVFLPSEINLLGNTVWSNDCKLEAITYNSAPALRVTDGGFYARGDMGCSGTKYRVVETEHYGNIGMNAMESASPYFTDIGSGTIGESGEVTIFYDPVFAETVDLKAEYQVFLTRTSVLETTYVEKHESYFIVHGEPGATFDWMLCAKQRDYSASRLERVDIDAETEVEFDDSIFSRDNQPVEILEEAYNQYEEEVNLL